MRYYNEHQLEDLGWDEDTIAVLLGEPDRQRPPITEYLRARVDQMAAVRNRLEAHLAAHRERPVRNAAWVVAVTREARARDARNAARRRKSAAARKAASQRGRRPVNSGPQLRGIEI